MDIAEDPDDAAIVAAIIVDEQLEFLVEHGCSSFQGFLFSRALPAEEFAELMANASLPGSEPSAMTPRALRQQLALSQ
jgi:EAL domain-containing protein (putative c-di-GMP-specific phosphodiesterase class I)